MLTLGLRFLAAAAAAMVFGACPSAIAADNDEQGAPIAASQAPHMKAGLWTHTEIVNGGQSMTETYCDAGRALAPPRIGRCSGYELKRTRRGDVIADTVCKDETGALTQKQLIYQGDFSASFTIFGDLRFEGNGESLWVVGADDYRYLGPCPPGMEPQG